jgi:hypothetical protein
MKSFVSLVRRSGLHLQNTKRFCQGDFRMASRQVLVKYEQSALATVQSPWKEEKDPNGSNLTYWWNPETNETTALGAVKPQYWVQVKDPAGSDSVYWWNVDTNETTALGSPNPNLVHNLSMINQSSQQQPVSFGKHMVNMAALGFGMSFAIIAVRSVLGF